ncbi:hypothetical protein BpHYR1_037623, partial [Brachionus plicatilis]
YGYSYYSSICPIFLKSNYRPFASLEEYFSQNLIKKNRYLIAKKEIGKKLKSSFYPNALSEMNLAEILMNFMKSISAYAEYKIYKNSQRGLIALQEHCLFTELTKTNL